MTTSHIQKEVPIIEDSTNSTNRKGILDYYLIVKDNKGKCLSFNYCNSNSQLPYSGFKRPVPEHFRLVIKDLIDEKYDIETTGFEEYIKDIEFDDSTCRFLVTKFNVTVNSSDQHHILVRFLDQFNSLLEDCNRQLSKERNLNKINSRCISSVSHDFRTPLSIIYANLQLLEYHEFQLDQATIEDAFSLSRMAVKSLLRVLDKVTVVDSINKGRLEYKPSVVNLKLICENLVKGLNEAEVVPDRLQYDHDDSILEIEIDEYLFTSLFTHLIFNALSYSKKNHKVFFKSQLISTDCIRFTVEDNGIGLTVEQLDSLNEFFNSTDDFHSEIVGLGLAIVKECLQLQRGKVFINSELGKGTKFVIDLPINY